MCNNIFAVHECGKIEIRNFFSFEAKRTRKFICSTFHHSISAQFRFFSLLDVDFAYGCFLFLILFAHRMIEINVHKDGKWYGWAGMFTRYSYWLLTHRMLETTNDEKQRICKGIQTVLLCEENRKKNRKKKTKSFVVVLSKSLASPRQSWKECLSFVDWSN